MRIAQIAILLVLFNFIAELSFCIIHLPFCLFEMATTKKEFQAMCRGLTQPRNELGCLGPLYAIVIFIGVGERARWRAWAFPPCTPRIPFHGDGACTLVLHRGVELRPLCAWVHTPRPWLPPCRAGSVIRRPGGDAPNHRDPARLKG